MILRWTWAPWWGRTLSLTFPVTLATPSPWTVPLSPPYLWISWMQALITTSAQPARHTPSALDLQATCVMEGNGWASIPTMRTHQSLFPCLSTHRAPLHWITTVLRTCFLPHRVPTAPRFDLCCTVRTCTHLENSCVHTSDIYLFLFGTKLLFFNIFLQVMDYDTAQLYTHVHIPAHAHIHLGGTSVIKPLCGQPIHGPTANHRRAGDRSMKQC